MTEPGFATLVYGNDHKQLFGLLANGRLDLVVVNDQVGRWIVKQHYSQEEIVALPQALSSNSAYITFSQKYSYQDLIAKFNYGLFSLIADGTYNQIYRDHQMRP